MTIVTTGGKSHWIDAGADLGNDIERIALDLIERFGDFAASIARELADIANERHGAALCAERWREITDAIERALRQGVTGRRVDGYG